MADPQKIDIDYVANLARIALTDEEKKLFSTQLGDILGYIEKLKSADVSNVEPMAHAFPVYNVWDEDEPVAGMSVDEALKNAPEVRDDMFVVPKVVE
ncbi:MAG: Asp-tRNA(Asn)/Glu-tRNA(Gln) amidotransferase subunit GatC [Opitutaceae bacterium]|nr:Asp-tRNA(Asn)/Glu-tRNA(Gln) amidotransferase subunit GatC [Opitutaceae bacterium]